MVDMRIFKIRKQCIFKQNKSTEPCTFHKKNESTYQKKSLKISLPKKHIRPSFKRTKIVKFSLSKTDYNQIVTGQKIPKQLSSIYS